jgi:hypothetical protein
MKSLSAIRRKPLVKRQTVGGAPPQAVGGSPIPKSRSFFFCINCDRSHYRETKVGQAHKAWEFK